MKNINNGPLWLALTDAFHNLYDPHTLYAESARVMSERYDTRVLFALKARHTDYFVVWSCAPNKKRTFEKYFLPQETLCRWLSTKEVSIEKAPLMEVGQESSFWEHESDSAIVVPMPDSLTNQSMSENGVFVVFNAPDLMDEEPFDSLAELIFTYIERARLKKETIQLDVEYQTIATITNQLSAKLALNNVFNFGAAEVQNMFYAEAVSVGLVNSTTNLIEFVPELLPDEVSKGMPLTLSLDQGIAGWVVSNKQSVIVNDPYNDPRFFSDVDKQSGFKTDNVMAAPLILGDEVIGVIEIINKGTGVFTKHDKGLLETIANMFAAAIRSADLHEGIVAEKQRVEAVFDSMSEGLLSVTQDGKITAVNESLLLMLDRTQEALKGKSITDLFPAQDHVIHSMMLKLNEGVEYPQTTSIIEKENKKDGIPVLISAATNDYLTNGFEAVFTFSDITQVRELERMRDDLFHGIVHELRTPLATILLYARLIKSEKTIGDKEKFNRFLNLIEFTSDDLQNTVRRMLQLAEMNSADFKRTTGPVNMNKILKEVLPDRIMEAEHKGLQVKTDISDHLPSMIGDYELIKLIFTNLVTNAIKFSEEGQISIAVKKNKSSIVAVVEDQGIGIPDEALPNMYRRFHRTKTAVEHGIAGTGIGLHMVKQAVDVHKGSIKLESEEQRGTKFTITLPLIPNL